MFSKFLSFPFVIVLLVCLYFVWEGDLSPIYIVPNVIILASIYVLSPHIDWLWYQRNPPEMDGKLRAFLEKVFPYYRNLAPKEKERFRIRVNMYMIATEFMPKAMENVPDDIKGLIAANVVMLTFGQKDYRLPKFERIVVYPHPFPSPQFPKHLHASEIFEEDGVILFSLEQLVPGVARQTQFYNIALHEYAKIFMLSYPENHYPEIDAATAEKLEIISDFKNIKVQDFIGLPMHEPSLLAINYFFTFPLKFKNELPEIFDTYSKIFNQNPLNFQAPVIDNEKRGHRI